MIIKFNKIISVLLVLSFLCISAPSFLFADGGNVYLGDLPDICNKYLPKFEDMYKIYRKEKNKEKKAKLKAKRNALQKKFREAIAIFNKTTPLKGKELPFKIASKNLPFEVQNIKISGVSAKNGGVMFVIKVKINKDIKGTDGKLSQRINVYFIAADSKDKIIPKTGNWATNHDWIKLKAGTIYEVKGHWNANKVQNMEDFNHIKIMSKDDYKKVK